MPKIRLTMGYNQPADKTEFFKHFEEVHVPLARSIPGAQSYEWAKVVGTPTGETPRYVVIASLTFNSRELAGAGMNSPEGKATAADLAEFATDGTDIFISELDE